MQLIFIVSHNLTPIYFFKPIFLCLFLRILNSRQVNLLLAIQIYCIHSFNNSLSRIFKIVFSSLISSFQILFLRKILKSLTSFVNPICSLYLFCTFMEKASPHHMLCYLLSMGYHLHLTITCEVGIIFSYFVTEDSTASRSEVT